MDKFIELLNLCGRQKPNIQSDSRRVKAGDIFIAIPGANEDGAAYIMDAIDRGASHVVCHPASGIPSGAGQRVQIIRHDDPRKAVWQLARARYEMQEPPFRIVGITGTNGKTTSAFLLEHLFREAGFRTGVLGTVDYHWPGEKRPAPLTTPDPLSLYAMLAEMAQAEVDIVFMEVSSHALAQQRVSGLPFAGAIFTNLTQDHLDFHNDMESYFGAKSELFLDLPQVDKASAINADNPYGRCLLDKLPRAISFGLGAPTGKNRHLQGKILSASPAGLDLEMSLDGRKWRLSSRLVGEFNAYNLLGAQALALELGLDEGQLAALENFPGVCGRLERIPNDRGLSIFVDYAHTPDALEKAINALRGAGFKKILTVFGCGGNRDRTKRPLMGMAVAKLADVAILTSDNPRQEDPEAIIADVLPGLARAPEIHVEPDRRKATALALDILSPDAALLIAGKGHEDYQIIGTEKRHYSDQEVVRELLHCAWN